MNDILVITCDSVLLNAFLNYPKTTRQEIFEGCRIWVVTDNRDWEFNKWNSHQRARRTKPYSGYDEIQKVVDKSRDAGVPVFREAIQGKIIVQHYADAWGLKGDCRQFLLQNMFSVKTLAVAALYEFFDLQTLLSVDDDTAFMQPARALFPHKFAISHHYQNITSIIDNPKNRYDFAQIAKHTGFDLGFDWFCRIKPCGGAIKLSDLDQYSAMWRSIYSDKYLANSRSNTTNMIDQVSVAQWVLKNRGYLYTSDTHGEVYTNSPYSKDGKTSARKSINPTLWHYVVTGTRKHHIAAWLERAEFHWGNTKPYWEAK